MKTETKKMDKCQVQLTVTLDADEAKACIKEVEKAFVREARLPGFRPGKAPIELIRKNFSADIQKETIGAMLRKHYSDAVKAEGLEEVALADVHDVSCTAEGGAFTAVVEVKPTFKLPTYKGLKIAPANVKVEDSEVAGQVERLRAMYAKYEDAKEGEAVADGDFVQIDYSGTIDGKPILELAPDAKIVANGVGFWTQVVEGHFLPEILEAVKGMKAGETKDGVKAKFDAGAAPEPLKGKNAVYTVTLKSFRRRVLPNDAEFAEKAKAANVDELAKNIRESLEKQRIDQEASRRESDVVELLLKKTDFDVPESQVRHGMDSYLAQLEQRAKYAGVSAEYIKENQEKILADARDYATKQVRLWYLFNEIAKAEKIESTDENRANKVFEFILATSK